MRTSLDPLYVVVLNYNLKNDTRACVESVLAAGAGRSRIVVVDNGSTDDSVAELSAHFGSELIFAVTPDNLGFAGGMNLGIRAALKRGAASLLLLSNDTVVDRALLEQLRLAASQEPFPEVLGPAIYYSAAPDRLWKAGDIRHRWLPMPLAVKKLPTLAPFAVDYVTGCAMLVRREVFERVGLFDTQYFAYYEDADFCRRAGDAGFKVMCVPQAKLWHKVSLTTRQDRPYYHYLRARNQVWFYRRHAHGAAPFLREVYIGVQVTKMMFNHVRRGDWNLIGPLWKGTYDGYRTPTNDLSARQVGLL
jgi:GT2 family glycosyltransferase